TGLCLLSYRVVFAGPATAGVYPLSLHDALPISRRSLPGVVANLLCACPRGIRMSALFSPLQVKSLTLRNRIAVAPMCQYSASEGDRKSTRLNSSHVKISYAVFCLKKKN